MTAQDDSVTVAVRNLGGIDEREVSFGPGVSVLTGRNATNRTSLLRSIAAALGGSAGELKGDADEGAVELTIGEDTYTRRFERRDGAVRTAGDPYTDEASLVDLFSCLLAVNPARRAVERGDADALREVVMDPVDTAAIREGIRRHQREVRRLDDRLADLEDEIDRLPDLEQRLADRREERADVVDELASVREAVDEFEADAEAAQDAESVVADLKEARSEFETVRNRLETQRNALESLTDERDDLADDLEETTAPEAELDDAKAELERLQRRQRELETEINNLVSIVEFNADLVEEAADDLPGAGDSGWGGAGEGDPDSGGADGDGADVSDAERVVSQLNPDADADAGETVECWTCGTAVERDAIAERIDDLRDVVDEKRRERNEIRTEIGEQRETVADLRSAVQERRSIEAELDDVDEEIERRESRVDDLEARADRLRDRIDDLEARASEAEDLRDSELLERYQRLSELEYERGQLDEEIDSLEAEIEAAEDAREERDRLEREREDHRAELDSLRGRIADLEREAVETFNDHMATVLDVLGYENVERVWIERRTEAGADDVAPESAFDLHVVRSTPDGAVYEDTVDHLSESEREVIGLVVALAGYLLHDVHETVPMMLLDSLEAIDADRIAALVDYFADYAPYLVVALLPEDAQALADEHERVVMDEAVA